MMAIELDLCRQRWWILILVHAFYLAMHSYWLTILAAFAFDLAVNMSTSALADAGGGPWDQPWENLWIDAALRLVLIVVGATINALLSYAFQLSFFQGLVYLYAGIIALVHLMFRFVEMPNGDATVYVATGTGLVPRAAVRAHEEAEARERAKSRRDPRYVWPHMREDPQRPPFAGHYDYFVVVSVVALTLAFMDSVEYAEPQTYAVFVAYAISVFLMVLCMEVEGREWPWLLAFVAFWMVVVLIGATVYAPHVREAAMYFTEAPANAS